MSPSVVLVTTDNERPLSSSSSSRSGGSTSRPVSNNSSSSPAIEEEIEGSSSSSFSSSSLSDTISLPGGGTTAESVNSDLEELERFAGFFKQKRTRLGFTQGDVGLALGRFYGIDFSQTTISRFEALNLSFKNMCKLKTLLQKWLDDTELAMKTGTFNSQIAKNVPDTTAETMVSRAAATVNVKRRKKRTSIEGTLRIILEQVFRQNPRPSSDVLDELASTLDMKRDVVRVWFCNRRQKERRSHSDKIAMIGPIENDDNDASAAIWNSLFARRDSDASTITTASNSSISSTSAAGLLLFAQNPYLVGLF